MAAADGVPGVVCLGNIVWDILVRPIGEPGFNQTVWVDTIEQQLGGNGAATSYTLGKLGVPVRLIGCVGADDFGRRLLRMLESVAVDTRWIARSPLPTATTVALVRTDGARALLHRPGASAEAAVEFAPELVAGCSRFHLANIFAMPGLRAQGADVLRAAREAGLETSLDTGWDARGEWMTVLAPCLAETRLLFVNEQEAWRLTGIEPPEESARALQEFGPRVVVVKLGERGCLVRDGGDMFAIPALQVPVVDTTGAGDCFTGAFLAALQRGEDYRAAAASANEIGALSVSHVGGITGLQKS